EQAFDKELADFPNMIEEDESLYISTIKHSTYIDVNEEGTEAAGSTSVEMETTSMPVDEPFDLTFDHPFTMLITDEETGAVLFMGDIYDVAPYTNYALSKGIAIFRFLGCRLIRRWLFIDMSFVYQYCSKYFARSCSVLMPSSFNSFKSNCFCF